MKKINSFDNDSNFILIAGIIYLKTEIPDIFELKNKLDPFPKKIKKVTQKDFFGKIGNSDCHPEILNPYNYPYSSAFKTRNIERILGFSCVVSKHSIDNFYFIPA